MATTPAETPQSPTPTDIIAKHMRDCSRQSGAARDAGDTAQMYKLNTAWHWLAAVEKEIAETAAVSAYTTRPSVVQIANAVCDVIGEDHEKAVAVARAVAKLFGGGDE